MKTKLMPAAIMAAMISAPGAVMANPAVTAWPWEDTVIRGPNFGRACHFADGHTEGTPKPPESFVEFSCRGWDEYKKNAAFPVPTCEALFPAYFCTMEDCISYLSRTHVAQSVRNGSYYGITACAAQAEPGATWQFDDSP